MLRRRLTYFALATALASFGCGRTEMSREVDPRADARGGDTTPTDADVPDSTDDADGVDAPDTEDVQPDTDVLPDADVSPDPDVGPDTADAPDVPGCIDRDGDGYGVGNACLGPDCNDDDSFVNPAAEEVCNDVDDDCDGENDEGCPPDLIVDGETIELDGSHLYDRVDVLNGGRINVVRPDAGFADRCGPGGPGCLAIEARIILVRADSWIDASGAGQCSLGLGDAAGFGGGLRNVGPGGGGYGGAGGAGEGLSGGPAYGTPTGGEIQFGSPGRGFLILEPGFEGGACDDLVGLESHGGAGGGCIVLSAPDVRIDGNVITNGVAGERARDGATPAIVDGGAGGSGGGLLVTGERVQLGASAILTARGGNGGTGGTYAPGGPDTDSCIGNGGGGGGGGRVKIFAGTLTDGGVTVNVRGGAGATGPQSDGAGGAPGTVFIR